MCSFYSACFFCIHSAQQFAPHIDLSQKRATYNVVPPRRFLSPLHPVHLPTRAPKESLMPLLLYASTCASGLRFAASLCTLPRPLAPRFGCARPALRFILSTLKHADPLSFRRSAFAPPSAKEMRARQVPSFALLRALAAALCVVLLHYLGPQSLSSHYIQSLSRLSVSITSILIVYATGSS